MARTLKNKMKKNMGNVERIESRSGPIFFKLNDHQKEKMMSDILSTMKLYAVDNSPLGKECNVINIVDSGIMTSIILENTETNEKKSLVLPTDTITKLKEKIISNNFTSWKHFRTNLLPSYNGPDDAFFIGLTNPEDGISYGFMFKSLHYLKAVA